MGRFQRRMERAIRQSGVLARLDLMGQELVQLRGQIDLVQREMGGLRTQPDEGLKEIRAEVDRLEARVNHLAEEQIASARVLTERVTTLVNRFIIPLGDSLLAVLTPYGFVVVPTADAPLATWLASTLDPEPGTCRLIQSVLNEGDIAVDVGANAGLMTLVMGKAVGPKGKTLAIEPLPMLQESLRETVRVNGLQNRVSVVSSAIGDHEGEAILHLATTSGWSSLFPLPREESSVPVAMSTLDAIVPAGQRVDLVKVDVEGAELLVLSGMRRLLADNPDVLVIAELAPEFIERVGGTVRAWLDAFSDAGLNRVFEIDETAGLCRPLRPLAELEAVASLNLAFIRNNSAALSRLPLP